MIVPQTDSQQSVVETRRIFAKLINPPKNGRHLDLQIVQRLQVSIAEHGLLQPIVVQICESRFTIVAGSHRLAAILALGDEYVEAKVFPAGTPPAQMLIRSLHENSIRSSETVEDTLNRVAALAAFHACSFGKAAKLADISKSKLSKIQTSVKKLSPDAMALARDKKIGIGVLYEVAKKARNEAEQLDWLTAHANRTMSRQDIANAVRKDDSRKIKRSTVKTAIDGISISVTVPAEKSYDQLQESLQQLIKKIQLHRKHGIPFHLLQDVIN
ncbi:Nucleoid occlusion protein [Roseimaritima multifibrata]|uniref:Nucleoid occlusion protein n=1 Tax=Roseimaritima multifibrata TaxID=1930274 RepID=A0A517M970_9BACT|nr:ParB/RepB/Spo0J family partition protein [Roseimaritima multifibrata]QDS91436.1 Nucleoid occlusion protein [Roseimaritima multifibrata]